MTHSSRRVVPTPPAHPRKDPPAPRCPSRQTRDDFVRWVPSGLQASRVMVATSGPGCLSPSAPACTGVHGSRGPRRVMCSTHGSCNCDTCFWELPMGGTFLSTFPRLTTARAARVLVDPAPPGKIPDKASSTLGAAQTTDARLPRRRYTSTRSGRLRSWLVDSSEPSRVPRSPLCIETTKVPTIDERSTS